MPPRVPRLMISGISQLVLRGRLDCAYRSLSFWTSSSVVIWLTGRCAIARLEFFILLTWLLALQDTYYDDP
jgi:hypothetical protein